MTVARNVTWSMFVRKGFDRGDGSFQIPIVMLAGRRAAACLMSAWLLLPCPTVSALPPRQGQCVHRRCPSADWRPMTGTSMWPTIAGRAGIQNPHLLGCRSDGKTAGDRNRLDEMDKEWKGSFSTRTTVIPIVRGPSGRDAVEKRRWNRTRLLNLGSSPAPGAEKGRVNMPRSLETRYFALKVEPKGNIR